MKKLRLIIRISTIILVILALVGIVLLILDENDAKNTTYEIIAFSVGMAGMLMAVFSQVDAAQQEKEFDRMARRVNQSIRSLEEIDADNEALMQKVDEGNQLDRKIYAILSKHEVGDTSERKTLAKKISKDILGGKS